MDVNTIATIISSVLAIIAAVAGAKYKSGKDTVTDKLGVVSKLLTDVIEAAKDDKIDEVEFQKIVDDVKSAVSKPAV